MQFKPNRWDAFKINEVEMGEDFIIIGLEESDI